MTAGGAPFAHAQSPSGCRRRHLARNDLYLRDSRAERLIDGLAKGPFNAIDRSVQSVHRESPAHQAVEQLPPGWGKPEQQTAEPADPFPHQPAMVTIILNTGVRKLGVRQAGNECSDVVGDR